MRLRAWLDVGSLLKRKKKLFLSNGKLNISILIGPIVKSGLGHYVNTVSDSFDDEMAIREEENSSMHNLNRLKHPKTLSFASGGSSNKDSTEASGILL
ncbi:hypothetical protein Gogos_008980 [Gossypium gossypioides]|uniref:Uncharacterized protein n=1 Tax=Gossypium gossypioides TaxID=34282 RepID=A0A7J9CD45_GOSGO|nr:hypothetical protein [Gossypium gossypioides]